MKATILVIEDDNILRQAIRQALSGNGFTIIEAKDGKIGLDEALKEEADLILLDLILPKVDGFHILKKLHEKGITKKIPVVVMTVLDSDSSFEECKYEGARDYFIKSEYTLEEIVEKAKKHLKK